jgi:putative SOS response-associated peptidase YedK
MRTYTHNVKGDFAADHRLRTIRDQLSFLAMCNLYNITTSQEAMRQFIRSLRDMYGNLEPSLDVYKNFAAPIVRLGKDGEREIARAQFGLPTDPQNIKGNYDPGQSNIRHPHYHHWQQYWGLEHRCVVPATSFAEPAPVKDPLTGQTPNVWFGIDESRPLFCFAGIWTKWHGVRRVRDGANDFELFGFLTTKPNAVVESIHPKAMPVILRTRDEIDLWMSAPMNEALQLQTPLPDEALTILDQPKAPEEEPLLL